MRLDELVIKNQNLLSDTELIIWEFIDKNRELCENISIDELASHTHVSRTTVLRLAKHLGLSGFSELKTLLRLDNKNEVNQLSCQDQLVASFSNYMNKLKAFNFDDVIDCLNKASTIYAYGTGLLQRSVVSELKRSFLYINKLVSVIDSLHGYENGLNSMCENDVVIIVTYSGNNPELVSYAKKLKLRNIKVIMISVLKKNDLSKYADHVLLVDVDNVVNNLGPRYDRVLNYFVLIDFLVVAFMDREISDGYK